MSTATLVDTPEARHARLAVAGILMECLDYSPFDATRAAKLCSPDMQAAIMRAGRWPIQDQRADAVRHYAKRIPGFEPSPKLRLVCD